MTTPGRRRDPHQRGLVQHPDRPVRGRHRGGLRRGALAPRGRTSCTCTSGASAGGASAASLPGFCLAVTCRPPTHSSRCLPRPTARGRPGSSRCPRSWSTPSCSRSSPACGPWPGCTATDTPADFIRGRYGSQGLALAVAFTGILAVMPYIALQLVGIQAVLTATGIGGSATTGFMHDLPLIIAFIILAGEHVRIRVVACPGAHRVHQGHPDLRDDHRGHHLHPDPGRRLGTSSAPRTPTSRPSTRRPASRTARSWSRPGSGRTPRWPWARPWPCSCTRIRSPACSRPSGAT